MCVIIFYVCIGQVCSRSHNFLQGVAAAVHETAEKGFGKKKTENIVVLLKWEKKKRASSGCLQQWSSRVSFG